MTDMPHISGTNLVYLFPNPHYDLIIPPPTTFYFANSLQHQ